MAIAFDAQSGSIYQSATATGTVAHTVAATGNPILFALAGIDDSGTNHVKGFGYNGVALTLVGTSPVASNKKAEIWALINPTTGANNLIGTLTGNASNTWSFQGLSYTGVSQTTPVFGSAFGSFGGTFVTGTVTTGTANDWMVIISAENKKTLTAVNSTTNRGSLTSNGFTGFYYGDKGPVAVPAATQIGWTASAADVNSLFAASFSAVSGGVGTRLIQSTGTAVLGLGSTSTSWAGNTTTGNLIVVGVNLTNAAALGTVTSITDNQSNTYIRAIRGTISSLGDVLNTEIWYAKNIVGGAGSVTVSHTIDNCAMFAREYTGFNTLDVTSAANGSSTAPNTGTVTTTVANELVVVATGDDKGATQTWTAVGTYGDMVGTATTITGLSMEDAVLTATGAQTGTLTLGAAANWESLMATFFQATGKVGYMTMLGAGQI